MYLQNKKKTQTIKIESNRDGKRSMVEFFESPSNFFHLSTI